MNSFLTKRNKPLQQQRQPLKKSVVVVCTVRKKKLLFACEQPFLLRVREFHGIRIQNAWFVLQKCREPNL